MKSLRESTSLRDLALMFFAVGALLFLFDGEPDIVDLYRAKLQNAAGLYTDTAAKPQE